MQKFNLKEKWILGQINRGSFEDIKVTWKKKIPQKREKRKRKRYPKEILARKEKKKKKPEKGT
jgi:hypothetical protein